jgi:hypothetical protein
MLVCLLISVDANGVVALLFGLGLAIVCFMVCCCFACCEVGFAIFIVLDCLKPLRLHRKVELSNREKFEFEHSKYLRTNQKSQFTVASSY